VAVQDALEVHLLLDRHHAVVGENEELDPVGMGLRLDGV
jgi:hypothetical protein